jgi:hypothetical protein
MCCAPSFFQQSIKPNKRTMGSDSSVPALPLHPLLADLKKRLDADPEFKGSPPSKTMATTAITKITSNGQIEVAFEIPSQQPNTIAAVAYDGRTVDEKQRYELSNAIPSLTKKEEFYRHPFIQVFEDGSLQKFANVNDAFAFMKELNKCTLTKKGHKLIWPGNIIYDKWKASDRERETVIKLEEKYYRDPKLIQPLEEEENYIRTVYPDLIIPSAAAWYSWKPRTFAETSPYQSRGTQYRKYILKSDTETSTVLVPAKEVDLSETIRTSLEPKNNNNQYRTDRDLLQARTTFMAERILHELQDSKELKRYIFPEKESKTFNTFDLTHPSGVFKVMIRTRLSSDALLSDEFYAQLTDLSGKKETAFLPPLYDEYHAKHDARLPYGAQVSTKDLKEKGLRFYRVEDLKKFLVFMLRYEWFPSNRKWLKKQQQPSDTATAAADGTFGVVHTSSSDASNKRRKNRRKRQKNKNKQQMTIL